jgi:anti-sigma factor ChrR (cupin superfamily)
VVRTREDWQESGSPGFLARPLLEDDAAGVRTWLFKSEPGASAELHSHPEIEQIYVLEGTFSDGEASYGPGDFIVRAPGAPHITTCDSGSLSLVIYVRDGRPG